MISRDCLEWTSLRSNTTDIEYFWSGLADELIDYCQPQFPLFAILLLGVLQEIPFSSPPPGQCQGLSHHSAKPPSFPFHKTPSLQNDSEVSKVIEMVTFNPKRFILVGGKVNQYTQNARKSSKN